jgi:uncharacterized protein (DUF58 family)
MRAGALGGTAALVGLALSASSAATVLKLLLLALALAAGSAFAAFWIAAEHRAEEGREP